MARLRNPAGGVHGGYGWLPDLPDVRDKVFEPDMEALSKVSQVTSLDLSTDKAMPKVWQQSRLGSCTAHSVGASFAFAHKKAGHRAMMPSRLWIYFQERLIEGTVNQDSGAMIRDGFKACATVGVPHESKWPYDISTFQGPPPPTATHDAVLHKDLVYTSVPQTLEQIKAALIGGSPVSFGFSVYEAFESAEVAQSGMVPMPQPGESLLGGHAVIAVGFDDAKVALDGSKGMWLCRNSWGLGWGSPEKPGYFWMPFQYLLNSNLADDFWQCSLAS